MRNLIKNSICNILKCMPVLIFILTFAFPSANIFAASPNNLQLIDVKIKNISDTGFVLEFTVNDTAVLNGASIVFAYTADNDLKVTADNISDLPNSTTVQLSQLKNVAKRSFESVFSVNVTTAPVNLYRIYVMLKTDTYTTDISSIVLNCNKKTSCYSYIMPTLSPSPTPLPATVMPTVIPTATPTPRPASTVIPDLKLIYFPNLHIRTGNYIPNIQH